MGKSLKPWKGRAIYPAISHVLLQSWFGSFGSQSKIRTYPLQANLDHPANHPEIWMDRSSKQCVLQNVSPPGGLQKPGCIFWSFGFNINPCFPQHESQESLHCTSAMLPSPKKCTPENGNTSSNGRFSIAILVFVGVRPYVYREFWSSGLISLG